MSPSNRNQTLIANLTRPDRQASKEHAEKLVDTLRAVLEETDCRIHDLKKEAFMFKRDVVIGGENAHTKGIMTEKVEAYFKEKMRLKDDTIGKLRLTNNTYKRKMRKVEHEYVLPITLNPTRTPDDPETNPNPNPNPNPNCIMSSENAMSKKGYRLL